MSRIDPRTDTMDEHSELLRLCEQDGLDMTACRAMSLKELRDMWADYQSDQAMMEHRDI
jgi:hypothetical protein